MSFGHLSDIMSIGRQNLEFEYSDPYSENFREKKQVIEENFRLTVSSGDGSRVNIFKKPHPSLLRQKLKI